MDKLSRTDECITIGRCKVSRSLFADDLVLLTFSKCGLQHALTSFTVACNIARMKISASKTYVVTSVEKSCPKFFASWLCIVEADGEVQLFWGWIHK